jgi:hypothetical protein
VQEPIPTIIFVSKVKNVDKVDGPDVDNFFEKPTRNFRAKDGKEVKMLQFISFFTVSLNDIPFG